MNITEEQFETLIGLLAVIETSGSVNGKPVMGLEGAVEAFFTIQEFVAQLEKKHETNLHLLQMQTQNSDNHYTMPTLRR